MKTNSKSNEMISGLDVKNSKLSMEQVSPEFGSSFTVRSFTGTVHNKEPGWHFHPEMEMVYVNGGSGKRHIGKHLSHYSNGDLLLMGANLPHLGFTDRFTKNKSETVIQFKPDFLGKVFFDKPEMQSVKHLFEFANKGIRFSTKTKRLLGPSIEALVNMNSYQRLIEFIKILKILSLEEDYKILNNKEYKGYQNVSDNGKISSVYNYINRNYKSGITLQEIADDTNMTVPAFCRFFKKQSGKTFTTFINESRIVHACKLLSESSKTIIDIADESGYSNYSYFNKQFQKITGKTPSQYRNEFRQLIN